MTQPKPERGTKRTCRSCDARFYDMARAHPVCPKCGAEFVEIVRPTPAYQPRKKGAFGNGMSGQPPEVVDCGNSAMDQSRLTDEDCDPDDENEEETDGEQAEVEDSDD